ncbi:MAG: class I SAM-dependent methyltransferase [Actinomycetota bacterium]
MFRRRRPSSPSSPRPAPARDWRGYDGVAEAYTRTREPLHEAPARDLVAAVDPPPGGRMLDVGTGPGVAARAGAEVVGAGGLVIGVDRSVEMLRRARAGGVRAAAADAIDLPFRDATFDAVTGSFVILLFTNYRTAVFDMLRVLRPGGRLGVSTWGASEDEFRRTWREVAESFVGRDLLRDAQRRAAPWEERFADPARLEEALRDAGLRPVRVERREYRFTHTIEEYLVGRDVSVHGRFVQHMLGESLWPRFRTQVEERFRERFAEPIGDTAEVILGVGTKP